MMRDISYHSETHDCSWGPRNPRSNRRFILRSICIISVFGLICLIVQQKNRKIASHFALVSLRVLDHMGLKVTGADVSLDGIISGKTDSFGEWRDFIKVNPGSRILIEVSKQVDGSHHTGEKLISVPRTISAMKTPDLKTSIRLRKDKNFTSIQHQKTILTDIQPATKGLVNLPDFAQVSVKFIHSANRRNANLAKSLKDEIIPALKKKFRQYGIAVTDHANWQMMLRAVPINQKSGLIRTDLFWDLNGGEVKSQSFLSELSVSTQNVASRLFQLTKIHTPKAYRAYRDGSNWYLVQPERPLKMWRLDEYDLVTTTDKRTLPLGASFAAGERRMRILTGNGEVCQYNAGRCLVYSRTIEEFPLRSTQRRLTIELLKDLPQEAQVYISGIQGQKIGKRKVAYWGTPGTRSAMSVLVGDRLIYRKKILNSIKTISKIALSNNSLTKF